MHSSPRVDHFQVILIQKDWPDSTVSKEG